LRRHEARLAGRDHLVVPAPVAAQVVREPRRQARLMVALRGCSILPFGAAAVPFVGTLLAHAHTTDVVDGFVVIAAVERRAAIVTSDAGDITHLLDTLGRRLPVLAP